MNRTKNSGIFSKFINCLTHKSSVYEPMEKDVSIIQSFPTFEDQSFMKDDVWLILDSSTTSTTDENEPN